MQNCETTAAEGYSKTTIQLDCPREGLPHTGFDVALMVWFAIVLIVLGLLALWLRGLRRAP